MKEVIKKELVHALGKLSERVGNLEYRKVKEAEINNRMIKTLNKSVKTSSDRINIIDIKLATYAFTLEKLHKKVNTTDDIGFLKQLET